MHALPTNRAFKNIQMNKKSTRAMSRSFMPMTYKGCRKYITGIALAAIFLLLTNTRSFAQVVINELGIAPDLSVCDGDAAKGGEFIELFNKGCASVDISCNVILFVGVTSSPGFNPEGWSITIPAGTILPPCGYYVIGGSGKGYAGGTDVWGAVPVGGSSWINPLGPVNLDISTSFNTSMGGNQPGNLVDKQGEVYLLNASGTVMSSVSYNIGNFTSSTDYPAFSNAPSGCTSLNINALTDSPNNVNGVWNTTTGSHSLALTSSGVYVATSNQTPGKPTPASDGGQIACSSGAPSALATTFTNASCGAVNGSITIGATTGGTSPFTYSINGSAYTSTTVYTGLAAGTYSISVKDKNGCSFSKSVTISSTPGPSSAVGATTNVACNGSATGTATVTASGGTTPYAYTWTGGTITSGQGTSTASGLAAGTYTCTIKDANGCSTFKTVTLTQPAQALNVVPGTVKNVDCKGNATGSASVTVTGGTTAYTYTWTGGTIGGGQGTSTASGLAAGTYTCTVTDAHACTASQLITITQPASSLAIASSSSVPTGCGVAVGSATVTVSGGTGADTYTWSPAPGGGQSTNAATGLGAGNYTVTIHDANNCPQSQLFNITPAGGPSATISSIAPKCNSSCDGSASVVASGGTGTFTYSWTPSGVTAATASGLCAGTYTCTIHDGNNCANSQSVTITAPAVLAVTPASQTNILCKGNTSGSASVTVSGGTTNYTYSWTGGTIGSGQGTNTASGLAAGTYTCAVTDANTCTASQVFTLTEPAGALSLSTSSQTNILCKNDSSGTAAVSVSGGTVAYTYSWTGGLIRSGQGTNTVGGLRAGTYTCTVTDANGCSSAQTVTLIEPTAVLAVVISAKTNVGCNGNTTGSATVTASGGTTAYTYSWTGGTIGSGQGTASVSVLAAGTYTCTLTDANGCSAITTVIITQPAAVLVSTPFQSNVDCNGGTNGVASLTASGGTPAYTYSWTGGAIGSGQGTNTASGLAAGTYTCSILDSNGCAASQAFTISQSPVIVLTSSSTSATCGKNNGIASVTASGGAGSYTYSWSPAGGTGATANNLPAGGPYTCTVTDSLGCSKTTSTSVINTGLPPVAGINASGSLNFCQGDSIHLTGTGGGTYSWNTGDATAQITVLNAGTYTVTVTNACGQATATSTVTIKPLPTPSITGPLSICAGNSAVITAIGGTSYSWNTGQTTASINASTAGVYTVTASNACGSVKSTYTLQVNTVTASFTADSTNGFAAFTVHFISNSSPNAVSWSWDFGDNTSGTGANPTHTYSTTGTFDAVLTVTDANGCTSSYTVVINVEELPSWIHIPNVFTPNGDGINDIFFIDSKGIATMDVKIYDRWGVEMADLQSPNQGWDARTKGGSPASDGTYYFMLKATGNDHKNYDVKGYFALLR
jgi:gliding motility-associated-like protein